MKKSKPSAKTPRTQSSGQRSGQATLWLPIETAPEDSTVVDIWSSSRGRLTDYKREELSSINVFYSPVYSGVCAVRDATHWMPLPTAPQGSGTEAPQAPVDTQEPKNSGVSELVEAAAQVLYKDYSRKTHERLRSALEVVKAENLLD